MPRLFAILTLPLMLAACDNAGGPEATRVFKYYGTTQCNPHEGRLEALGAELRASGVDVLVMRPGDDGMMRIALCGAPDGRIGIFHIPKAQLPAARAAGFEPYTGDQ
ncbi:MAG: hypothetical protein Q4G36_05815 [Paracoccus sp. (in: a-proteobacteria)]|nr:hypothetical protein [Paracoccus sp. (in: a-proteobacteria)]